MRTLSAATLTAVAVLLGGCFGGSSGSNDPGPTNTSSGNNATPLPPATFRAQFQPAQGVLPYPTDLLLNGSTDGTVNAPILPLTPNVASVNALDGFSTTSDITITFSSAVDASTLTAPGAITVLETQMATIGTTTTVARVPIQVRRPLVRGVDYSVGLSNAVDALGQVVTITPLKPLTPSTGGRAATLPPGVPAGTVDIGGVGYTVIVTNALKGTSGAAAAPDTDYAQLRSVILGTTGTPNPANCAALTDPTANGLCNQIAPQLAIAAGAGLTASNVALTFSFTTQSTRDSLVALTTALNAGTAPTLALQGLPRPGGGILTTKNILDPAGTNAALTGNANVYAGTITLPYYLPTPADATAAQPAPPLTGQWLSAAPGVSILAGANCTTTPTACTRFVTRYNATPAKTRDVTIPVLATIPNAGTKPANGWPVVIFIHGIGGNRSNLLPIAESYASAGIAVVGIDLPVHGITPTDSAAALRLPGVAERTFDMDYINNTTRLPPADGVVDPSGANFIQVSSPITSRDNLRQAVVDNLTLARALPGAVAAGNTGPLFDGAKIHLSGISLGGIVGTTVASLPSAINTAALSVPGGTIAPLLLDSNTFGPSIGGAVAAQLGANTLLYKAFFRDAQAAVDAGDPINSIAFAVANKPVLIHKVVGDTVVPNNSTDRLIAAAVGVPPGLPATTPANTMTKVTAAGLTPVAARSGAYVTFTRGSHGSLLDPTVAAAVTVEMQREFVGFAVANGAAVSVTDATNVQNP